MLKLYSKIIVAYYLQSEVCIVYRHNLKPACEQLSWGGQWWHHSPMLVAVAVSWQSDESVPQKELHMNVLLASYVTVT